MRHQDNTTHAIKMQRVMEMTQRALMMGNKRRSRAERWAALAGWTAMERRYHLLLALASRKPSRN